MQCLWETPRLPSGHTWVGAGCARLGGAAWVVLECRALGKQALHHGLSLYCSIHEGLQAGGWMARGRRAGVGVWVGGVQVAELRSQGRQGRRSNAARSLRHPYLLIPRLRTCRPEPALPHDIRHACLPHLHHALVAVHRVRGVLQDEAAGHAAALAHRLHAFLNAGDDWGQEGGGEGMGEGEEQVRIGCAQGWRAWGGWSVTTCRAAPCLPGSSARWLVG